MKLLDVSDRVSEDVLSAMENLDDLLLYEAILRDRNHKLELGIVEKSNETNSKKGGNVDARFIQKNTI